ncbi:MAG TPA: sce7726 family protein [Thermoanaerobaculaceae bacterium]|nr:sce7726 family protein [Thermoanaerobaculaceae bacterium]
MSTGGSILGDGEVRTALRSRLLAVHAEEPDTLILDELGLCRGLRRADMAVVNGFLHGYEIKSERDSLRRLAAQADLYNKVFDRVTLVVAERHLPDALDVIPGWWAVLGVRPSAGGPRFSVHRRGRRNSRRDARALVELLWLDDALGLLAQRNAARGVRGRPRQIVWDRVCGHFSVDEIAAAVRAGLKARATSPSRQSSS